MFLTTILKEMSATKLKSPVASLNSPALSLFADHLHKELRIGTVFCISRLGHDFPKSNPEFYRSL